MTLSDLPIPAEAIYSIFDGRALAFLGAGFSYGAINQLGAEVPNADDLATLLMEEIGEIKSPKHDLKKCAGYVDFKMGREFLLQKIAQHVCIPTPADHQREFISYPWTRIYTTNYDNVVFDCKTSPKSINKIGLNDSIPNYSGDTTECVYINGFLESKLDSSTIVITDSDYEAQNSNRDTLISLFRDDVSLSSYVFFIGYSLYDIDVARILQQDKTVKSKVFIISGEKISNIDSSRLSEYGTVIKYDCDKLLPVFSKYKEEYNRLPPRINNNFLSLKKVSPAGLAKNNASGEEVRDLIFKGRLSDLAPQNWSIL